MLARGDWITPTFNGAPRFDKPVLFYWLIMGSYAGFGVSEFAVRLWSALAGMALVLLTAWAARRWLPPSADFWAGVALATCFLTALLARAAVTDMLLALCVTAAILAGVAALEVPDRAERMAHRAQGTGHGAQGMAHGAERTAYDAQGTVLDAQGTALGAQRTAHGAQRSARGAGSWALFAWAAMALAVLVKGPIGLVIPAITFGLSLPATREVRFGLRRLVPWQGLLLFLCLTLPWYLLVLRANGWAFVEGFVIKHHFTRYTGVVSSHAGPFWFYLPVLLIGFFPWSGYLPSAGWRAWQILRRRRAERHGDRLIVVCACWAAAVFVFFSLAGTKLPSYLFPAFPALALLVAGLGISNEKCKMKNRPTEQTVARFSILNFSFSIDQPRIDARLVRLAPWLIGGVGAALAIGFALLPWILELARPAARGILDGVEAPTALAFGLAGLLGVGTTTGLCASGWRRPSILAAMMVGVILAAALLAAPKAHAILQGALREFSDDARRLVPPDGTVVAYGLNAPSIVFYAERRVLPLGPGTPDGLDRIQRLLAEGRPIVVISRSAHAPILDRVPGLIRGKARSGFAIYWPRAASQISAAPR
ncbi:MAG: glycosyltransferase family 39 protein [candidate division NC10 bacterium]|nr:glycosyltransferase family 39 protein [candidate division NC10 bacterium]